MAELLKGRISDAEGLQEVLEIITTFKEVSQAVLDVTTPSISGKIGVAWGRFITGALITGSDEKGKKALRQLLIVRQGTFTFQDLEPQAGVELRQSLGIDLARTASVVPELNYKEAHFLYDLGEVPAGEAVVSAPAPLEYDVLEAWTQPRTQEELNDTIDLSDRLNPILVRTSKIQDLTDSSFNEPPLVDMTSVVEEGLGDAKLPYVHGLPQAEPMVAPISLPVMKTDAELTAVVEEPVPSPALYVDLKPFIQAQSATLEESPAENESAESLTGPTASTNTLLDSVFSAHIQTGPIEPSNSYASDRADLARQQKDFSSTSMGEKSPAQSPLPLEVVSSVSPPTPIKPKLSSSLLRAEVAGSSLSTSIEGSALPLQEKRGKDKNGVLIAVFCILFFVVSCAGTVTFGPQIWAFITTLLHLQH